MKYGGKRNLQLDVLRGIAILLVFGRHLELPRPGGLIGGFAATWYQIGWLGVDLFFVLSGFLIGGLLVTELQKHGRIDVTRFLIRRGLKIYPAYFVFLAYLMLMPTAKALIGGGDAWATFFKEWSAYWPNLLFLQNYVGSNPAGHTWTLAVEEHFYLMLPFALVALVAMGRVRVLIPLCLLVVPALLLGLRCLSVWTSDPFAVKMSATHLRLDALLFGVGVRGVAQYWPERFAAMRRWRSWLVPAGLALWSLNLFIEPGTGFIRTIGLTGTYLGSAAFLVAAYQTRAEDFGRLARFASPAASLVAWIGVYSYAIYLWHVTAMGILEREFGGRMLAWAGGSTEAVWLLSTVVVCVGAILAGVVASKVVEWPVLRLRDRFFPSRSGTLPAGESAASAVDESRKSHASPSAAPTDSAMRSAPNGLPTKALIHE
jgi:peptidoglycan/LPS O-acetylase OafA/YrhL